MWLVGVVIRRGVWLVGGICGCGYQEVGVVVVVRRYIGFFIILLIPTPLVLALFPTSLSMFLMFFRSYILCSREIW